MNRICLIIFTVFWSCITSYGQTNKNQHHPGCPIKEGTTKISYSHHTGSGIAIYTSVDIYPDSLVWNYNEARNNCDLEDVCKYNRKEFEEMIQILSAVSFTIKEPASFPLGGSGFGYNFEDEEGCYLNFGRNYQLSGNYQEVYRVIQRFINSHKTECEKLFEQLSKKPHERAHFGEFKELPIELKKYQM